MFPIPLLHFELLELNEQNILWIISVIDVRLSYYIPKIKQSDNILLEKKKEEDLYVKASEINCKQNISIRNYLYHNFLKNWCATASKYFTVF